VTGGVIGLFIGPVMLAVGYELFWRWVKDQPQAERIDENEPARLAQTETAEVPKHS
jgi:predicted PurR-regulated permease PerM